MCVCVCVCVYMYIHTQYMRRSTYSVLSVHVHVWSTTIAVHRCDGTSHHGHQTSSLAVQYSTRMPLANQLRYSPYLVKSAYFRSCQGSLSTACLSLAPPKKQFLVSYTTFQSPLTQHTFLWQTAINYHSPRTSTVITTHTEYTQCVL